MFTPERAVWRVKRKRKPDATQAELSGFLFSVNTYKELLRLPDWQKRRLQIFQRDNFKCVCCNSTEKELHVHHIDYFYNYKPWEYPDDMLITVCADCHEKENCRPKHETALLQSLRMKRFMADDLVRLSCLLDTHKWFAAELKSLLSKI